MKRIMKNCRVDHDQNEYIVFDFRKKIKCRLIATPDRAKEIAERIKATPIAPIHAIHAIRTYETVETNFFDKRINQDDHEQ